MESITWLDAAKAMNAKLPNTLVPIEGFNSVSTDTRTISPGGLFIALKGAQFDGHDFVEEARIKGAAAAVVQEGEYSKIPVLNVGDTAAAYLHLAGYYRSRFNIPVVGVTGSVGKTSTKEMVALALSSKYNVLKNQGNLNNGVGVPATLFKLENTHTAAVIEMGMNHLGEIKVLSEAAKPTISVITNIGFSHIEHLGSQDGILRAKLETLRGMEKGAPLILNGDDPLLLSVQNMHDISSNFPLLYYGLESQGGIGNKSKSPFAAYAADIKENDDMTSFTVCWQKERLHCELPLVGRHNIYNALAAFLAAVSTDVSPQNALEALKEYKPVGMRQCVEKKGEQLVIMDCYNASPDSVRAALDVLMHTTPEGKGRRIAVLSDMLELGEMAPMLHAQVGKSAAKSGIDKLICYGALSRYTAAAADSMGMHTGCTEDKDMLIEYLKKTFQPGDVVLFKGSRGMRLEEIVQTLYA